MRRAIVALAEKHGVLAPANATITALVHELETQSAPLPFLTPAQLRERIASHR